MNTFDTSSLNLPKCQCGLFRSAERLLCKTCWTLIPRKGKEEINALRKEYANDPKNEEEEVAKGYVNRLWTMVHSFGAGKARVAKYIGPTQTPPTDAA